MNETDSSPPTVLIAGFHDRKSRLLFGQENGCAASVPSQGLLCRDCAVTCLGRVVASVASD
jgi:hypothetical protein